MAASRIVKSVYVFEDHHLTLYEPKFWRVCGLVPLGEIEPVWHGGLFAKRDVLGPVVRTSAFGEKLVSGLLHF